MQALNRIPEGPRSLIQTAIYGISGGAAAVLFLILTNLVYKNTFPVLAARGTLVFAVGSFLIIGVSSLLVGILLFKVYPKAAGSGIPEIKAAYWNELGFIPLRGALVKLIGGVLSLGGGASLGREGPSVYISAATTSNVAGPLGVPKPQRRVAAAAGSAAGLAAAFNTPLAAITFVLEEVVGDLNSRFLGRVLLASVLGAFVTHAIVGKQPAFELPMIEDVSWQSYMIVPPVAAVAAFAGMIFQRWTIGMRGRLKKRNRIPDWFLPVIGGFLTWVVGMVAFLLTHRIGVFGLGYHDLSQALNEGIVWHAAAILVAGKLLATVFSYAWGGCGGIFSPTLFLGAMTGFALAGLVGIWFPLTPGEHVLLAAVGMSACFGAVVRAPFTGLLMIFEMTHQFSLIPGLMLGTLVSQGVARLMESENFYEAILRQDGHELSKISPPRDIQSWQNQPVLAIANFKPVVVRDLSPEELQRTLRKHPFDGFPLEVDGKYQGILTRAAIQEALKQKRTPTPVTAAACSESEPIHEVAERMVPAASHVAVILDPATRGVRGLVTLHDILRAQIRVLE